MADGQQLEVLPPEDEDEVRRRAGRPPYEPSAKDRTFAEMMSAAGIVEDDIAACIGISRNTLRKHFAEDLRRGRTNMLMNVSAAMVKRAMNPLSSGGAAAGIFILARRGGPHWQQPVANGSDTPLPALEAKDGAVFYFPRNGREV